MKKKKGFECVCILAASLLLTAGCSKKAEDITSEAVWETQTEQAAQTVEQDDFAQFREENVWNDDLQGTYKGEKADISFFARIEVPECTQSVVVEGKLCDFDEKYKETVLKGIAGEENIYYYDIAHRTTEDLERKLGNLEARIEDFDAYSDTAARTWDEQWEEYYDEDAGKTEEELKETLNEIRKCLATSRDEYTKAADFNKDQYVIKRNGRWCKIYFIRQESGQRTIFMDEGWDNGPGGIWKDAEILFAEVPSSNHDSDENECKFSPKEAGDEAVTFAEDAGIDGLVFMEAKNLYTSSSFYDDSRKDVDMIYGYEITLGQGVDGEPMFGTMAEEGMIGRAKVMDDGVFSFYVTNPMKESRISEHVSLLPLDKIKEAFKKELTENLDLYCSEDGRKFKFDTLTLCYLWQMKNESTGEGAYIPVWVLKDNSMDPQVRIYVNAIDGTVLDKDNLQ